ncbi:Tryptophan synthase alpha chain [Auxenochlorella protothecoides]|uniref:Tryptophan synthase alpha chain n=1 Tax=Auxenochlorella protothecoides TaxID=3075 RepID=A0A087SU58_AUXPR|nr:Tryptophan synthase alpha chain [Auxenochlorella protothecoides]KFM29262.1 Tryptophan synthase alpha chain [Auxenochlorella protothecoides]
MVASAESAALEGAQARGASITDTMQALKREGRVAFIPFLVACDPDRDTTVEAIRRLDALGASVIELGVPYCDPVADGPVIQAAATRGLAHGTTLDDVLGLVAEVAPTIKAPILLFVYFNPILTRGLEKFCAQAIAAGAKGLLVPDIPLEEASAVADVAAAHGLELVLLTTPTTPPERMQAIARRSSGFVYLVSITGVTGVKEAMEARVEGLIAELQRQTDKPVAVGFGVSRPDQARQLAGWGAEGVIVGSALVRALGEAASPAEGLDAMAELAASLVQAIQK